MNEVAIATSNKRHFILDEHPIISQFVTVVVTFGENLMA